MCYCIEIIQNNKDLHKNYTKPSIQQRQVTIMLFYMQIITKDKKHNYIYNIIVCLKV